MKLIAKLLCVWLLAMAGLGIYMSEGVVHFPRLRVRDRARMMAVEYAATTGSALEDIEIQGQDGTKLRAWSFHHQRWQDAVILLHGQGDNRAGMLGYGEMLLRHHYNVLIPDSRAHGSSEGTLVTYGVREAKDVRRWIDWLYGRENTRCVYGLGESMGAAILLESMGPESQLCAGVAESSFSDFRSIAFDRMGGGWIGHTISYPLVESGLLYARFRYGVDLQQASPLNSVVASRIPILLIHGLNDTSIAPHHSQRLVQANPQFVQLWEVPGTQHTGTFGRFPNQFEKRVCEFFQSHTQRH